MAESLEIRQNKQLSFIFLVFLYTALLEILLHEKVKQNSNKQGIGKEQKEGKGGKEKDQVINQIRL